MASQMDSGKNKYRKDKPWDTDDIDHWKIDPLEPDELKNPVIEESSFATLFPQYRESYLKETWPLVVKELSKYGIRAVLDLVEGSMSVFTTRKTWDPYIIIKARDMIKLLARSFSLDQAKRVLEDGVYCDVIKIGNIVRNRERFVKRRQRLVGPNGATLKAIELLTECYVMVQGNTVSAIGDIKGLKNVRRLVIDCMRNVHPIYNIKTLMIKRELMKDEELKGESWDRFLPKFNKQNIKRKKKKIKAKKEYTPFPPPQPMSKIDKQLESGEYFLRPEERDAIKRENRQAKQVEATVKRKAERESSFVAPKEDTGKSKKAKSEAVRSVSDIAESLKKKGEKKVSKKRRREEKERAGLSKKTKTKSK